MQAVSSITIMPPRAMIEPTSSATRSRPACPGTRGCAPPRDRLVWTALNGRPSRSAADVVDDLAQMLAWHLDQAGVDHPPASANTLVPLLEGVPMPAYQSPSWRMMGDVGEGLDVAGSGSGRLLRPRTRVWRAGPGRAPSTLDRGDQGRLLAAKHARAQAQLHLELKGGVGDVGAQ